MLACAGDTMALETLEAAAILRAHAPEVAVRVVNVVDLFALASPEQHPSGMTDERFADLFTCDRPVVFAYHGYPRTVHELIYRRSSPERFHVHRYVEEGTTTTPFDMVVLNRVSRYDLALDALRRVEAAGVRVPSAARAFCKDALARHAAYIRDHGEDMPEAVRWTTFPVPAARK